jgi:hypothetical protein
VQMKGTEGEEGKSKCNTKIIASLFSFIRMSTDYRLLLIVRAVPKREERVNRKNDRQEKERCDALV